MKRRQFLQLTATSTGGILLLPNFLSSSVFSLSNEPNNTGNILVFIQLNGGNDGLNTIIPYQDELYYKNRPTIAISKEKVVNLAQGLGFHPSLKNLSDIAQQGNFSLIQNVGYPNPNRSHFRSQEIWQTASDSDKYFNFGWLGRFLDIQCKDESLSALNIDGIDNLALKSEYLNNITVKDFNKLNAIHSENNSLKLSDNPQLDFVRKIAYASVEGSEEIQKALKNASKYNELYSNNELSKNLQWIAKLIKGNLNSKIYYTSLNGFDTHNNQITTQANKLTILNDAVFSFYNDLKNNNLLEKVTIIIFSEFGRRVKENGSGTDHGTAAPMFVIGGNNKGKIIGKNPNLSTLDNGDLIFGNDFRSVYATLLQEKFNFNPTQINIQQKAIKGIF